MNLITCIGQEPIYTRLAELLDLQDLIYVFYRICKNARLQQIVGSKLIWKTWAVSHPTTLQYEFLLAVRGSKNFILMKTLIECGANTWLDDSRIYVESPQNKYNNAYDYTMGLPVFLAVKKDCLDTLKLLHDNGASIRDPELLVWAIVGKNYDIAEYLWDTTACMPEVASAIAEHDPDSMQFLLDRRVDIDIHGYSNWTPLRTAASLGNYHMVKFLIDHGANPFINTINSTILDEALMHGINFETSIHRLATIQLLLDCGVKYDLCYYWSVKRMADSKVQEAIKQFTCVQN